MGLPAPPNAIKVANSVYMRAVSAWEVAIKIGLGRLRASRLPGNAEDRMTTPRSARAQEFRGSSENRSRIVP